MAEPKVPRQAGDALMCAECDGAGYVPCTRRGGVTRDQIKNVRGVAEKDWSLKMIKRVYHVWGRRQSVTEPLGTPGETDKIRQMDSAFVEHLRQAYARGEFPQCPAA